jgi:hypothetical protein
MIESTREKIAVFAPIPSASVNTAVNVNPGDLRNCRKANFRSLSIVFFCLFPWLLHSVRHNQTILSRRK